MRPFPRSTHQITTKPEEISRGLTVATFSCGKDSLDDWLMRRAQKSHDAKDSRVYVICNVKKEVVGYYAICAASVARSEGARALRKNAPDPIPMALIARLAVHNDLQGQGLGSALLRDAVLRIAQAADHIGIKGILVHALDADAVRFYESKGFRKSPVNDRTLMVLLSEVATELSNPPK